MFILKIFFLCLVIIVNGLIYQLLVYKNKEGYESLSSCLAQGYPKAFCFNVPIQACLKDCD
jgi:hypothetical protein